MDCKYLCWWEKRKEEKIAKKWGRVEEITGEREREEMMTKDFEESFGCWLSSFSQSYSNMLSTCFFIILKNSHSIFFLISLLSLISFLPLIYFLSLLFLSFLSFSFLSHFFPFFFIHFLVIQISFISIRLQQESKLDYLCLTCV